jgi:hypothetical protein
MNLLCIMLHSLRNDLTAISSPLFMFSFLNIRIIAKQQTKQTMCSESSSELYWPSDHRLSVKLVPTFAQRVCCVVSTTYPYGRILGFLNRSSYFFFQVPHQLYPRGWVNPAPDPLFLRKSGITGNRTRDFWICSGNSDHENTVNSIN